jgi:hypothetical protein
LINRAFTIAVAAAVLWFGWSWFFTSDEAEIRAMLNRVREGVQDAEGAGGVEALARIAGLQNEFAVDATVDAGAPFDRLNGRQAIVAAAARVQGVAENLELQFSDVDVTLAEDRQTAAVALVAEAHFDEAGTGRVTEARELEIRCGRVEGRWVITGVTLVQPLRRLDQP